MESIYKEEYMQLLDSWDALGLWIFLRTISEDEQSSLYNDFPKGLKVKYKRLHVALSDCGFMIAGQISVDIDCLAAIRDDQGLHEALEIDGLADILKMCSDETVKYIKDNLWGHEF